MSTRRLTVVHAHRRGNWGTVGPTILPQYVRCRSANDCLQSLVRARASASDEQWRKELRCLQADECNFVQRI